MRPSVIAVLTSSRLTRLGGEGKLGDTPKPPAGRPGPPAPLLWGRGSWGTPPNPQQGGPCTLFVGEKGEGISWGTPPNPRQGGPCTPFMGKGRGLGDTPKPPAGRSLHPLCWGKGR